MAEFWQMEFRENPAFGEGFVVTLTGLSREDVCRYEVRRGSWVELETDRHPRPAASGELPRADADAVFDALSRATVAAVPPSALGILDGVHYSLRVSAGGNGATYHWHCDLPDAWRVLQPAIDLLAPLAQARPR